MPLRHAHRTDKNEVKDTKNDVRSERATWLRIWNTQKLSERTQKILHMKEKKSRLNEKAHKRESTTEKSSGK